MSSFYKMDPARWDFGTAELSLEQEAAYLRIVNAIHKHDSPVPNIDRVLAGMFRCSTRKARALVSALVAAGKIVVEDGIIWNERARSDLVQRQLVSISSAERGAKGGRTRAENAAKALEKHEPPQAVASTRIEENRIEDIGGRGTREDDHDAILRAAKVDRTNTVAFGKWHSSTALWTVDQWRKLGLSQAQIIAEIESVMLDKTAPPGTLAYFNEAMRRAAGRLTAPGLTPIPPEPQKPGAPHGRSQAERDFANLQGIIADAAARPRRGRA